MTQRQERGRTSGEKPQVLVLRTFHVDHAKWTRLGELAEANGTNRSARLRDLIDDDLARHESGDVAA